MPPHFGSEVPEWSETNHSDPRASIKHTSQGPDVLAGLQAPQHGPFGQAAELAPDPAR